MTKISDARINLVCAQVAYDEIISGELEKVFKNGLENLTPTPTPALKEEGWESIEVINEHMTGHTRWIDCRVKASGFFATTVCNTYRINKNLYVFASFEG